MTAESRLSAALSDRYTVLRELGQGGMATVYLAEDVRHERKVALKVLRPELAAVLGAERFLKEIKTTANLQHPHILPLHDSGEAGGAVFYVMPYVEGESLRDRLNRDKQLPVEEGVRIAREVLSALDYAHRHGVVHRDIKPENILLHEGQAFVADFGIALAVSTAGAGTRMTETGMSLGTPHYMSPEQAMGEREVSARSDVYAMGCVLYEMLLGEPPFTGPTAQAIIARVITEEPRRMLAQRKTIPAHVESAVLKALAKLPADRFATAAEFAEALARVTVSVPVPEAQSAPPRAPAHAPDRSRGVVLASLGVAVGALGVAAWALMRGSPVPPAPMVKFEIAHPEQDRLTDETRPVAISPDGRTIAYNVLSGRSTQIQVHRLSELQPHPLPGTEGALSIMFSPDGQWLAFTKGPALYKVPLSGAEPTKMADVPLPQADGSWSPDGWVYLGNSANGILYRVRETGGPMEEVSRPDSSRGEMGHYRPQVLPDGKHLLFDVQRDDGVHPAILSIDSRTWSDLGLGVATMTAYSAGHVVFVQGNRVMAAPLDRSSVRVTDTRVVVDSLASSGSSSTGGIWLLVASRDGTVVHVSGPGALLGGSIIWAARSGVVSDAGFPRSLWVQPRIAPGGHAVAAQSALGTGSGTLEVVRVGSGGRTRIAAGATPVWAPDGRRVAHSSATSKGILSTATDGSSPTTELIPTTQLAWPYDWSRDGNTIAFYELGVSTKRDIHLLHREGSAWKRTPFLVTAANERSPVFSPDGRWIAYASDESGTDEIYVRSNPPSEGKWVISRDGGREPVWSADGKVIYFRNGDEILAAPVVAGAEFSSSEPRVLFRIRASLVGGPSGHRDWDVSRDGKRFVFVRSALASFPFTLTAVLNFQDGMRR